MIKKILLVVAIVATILVIWNYQLISYGIGQGIGQLKIVWNARPVNEYLQDVNVPDSIKQKLRFIEEVRNYAVQNLGLEDTDNYTTMYDQKGKPILWVVTGCEPFSFEAKQWDFPVLGKVPYKGFFDKAKADKESKSVKDEGLDVGTRTVGGWSTLGWFKDPILSGMLKRSYGDLANLIIHELVHATIFVKDSVAFNENLASFIGHEGAILFLRDTYGEGSEKLLEYQQDKHDEALQVSHVLRGAIRLKELYASFLQENDEQKLEAKNELIGEIMDNTDTLSFYDKSRVKYLKGKRPNNTYFMSYMRYEAKRDDLNILFKSKFDQDLTEFIAHFKQKHPFL